MFGEASYDFGQFKLTAGGRYYDFKEKRDFSLGRPVLERRHPDRRQDEVERLQPARDRDLGAEPTTSASTPRPPRASASAASTIRSTCRSARRRRPCTALRRLPELRRRNAVELRSRREIFEARHHLQRGRLLHRHQGPAGHARCRQLLVAHRLQRAEGAHDGRRSRVRRAAARGPRSVARRQLRQRRSSTPPCTRSPTRVSDGQPGIREGNRLPTVPKFQMAATANLRTALERRQPTGTSPPATSMSAAATRSRRTRRTIRAPSSHGLPSAAPPATGDDDRPQAAVLRPGQPLGRRRMGQRPGARGSTSTTCSTRTPCSRSTANAAAVRASASTSARRGSSA